MGTPETQTCGYRFGYDKEGNLVRLSGPRGTKLEWAYDALDRVVLARDPFGKVSRVEYNPAGQRCPR